MLKKLNPFQLILVFIISTFFAPHGAEINVEKQHISVEKKCSASPFITQKDGNYCYLINHSDELKEVIKVWGIAPPASLEDINAVLQDKFLRPSGSERFVLKDDASAEALKEKLYASFTKLHTIGDLKPNAKSYDIILIYGASLGGMRLRVHFLNQLWREGLRASKVVFLTGQRRLDPTTEGKEALYKSDSIPFVAGWVHPKREIKNETDAAQLVWDQVITEPDLKERVSYISVASVFDFATHEERRANTADTIKAWIAISREKEPLRCLAISSNPFIGYQHATIVVQFMKADLFSKGFSVETIGPGPLGELPLSTQMDNLARWFYTEFKSLYSPKK